MRLEKLNKIDKNVIKKQAQSSFFGDYAFDGSKEWETAHIKNDIQMIIKCYYNYLNIFQYKEVYELNKQDLEFVREIIDEPLQDLMTSLLNNTLILEMYGCAEILFPSHAHRKTAIMTLLAYGWDLSLSISDLWML